MGKMGWTVGISGKREDLVLLGRIYMDEPKITFQGPNVYLESERFDEFGNPDISDDAVVTGQVKTGGAPDNTYGEVYKKGRLLISRIRASELPNIDHSHPPALDGLLITPGGHPHVFIKTESSYQGANQSPAPINFSPGSTETIDEYSDSDIDKIDEYHEDLYIELPEKDDKSDELIRLVDNEYSWVNLYRVWEWIKKETDDSMRESWESEIDKDIHGKDGFKNTAQSPEALGPQARHVKSDGGPPDDPMSYTEAVELIHQLVVRYLIHRYKQVGRKK